MDDLNARTGIEDHTQCLDNHISQLLPTRHRFDSGRKLMLM